ncbi:39S ribosomal protein L46, mitochondrial-like [Portunus trituberculatus]|uniref:39S ribosomal protein L46, mitochondrial-like n=1 Tax=Portunus trituberculatus TaxID=210409 RepID=UPI001E1D0855|nr:39S ribosomal protein L46, mitochondrial-like [Portunus trituberculatus]
MALILRGSVRALQAAAQHIASRSMSSVAAGKWQIVGSACITRPPVVCPPMTSLEQQYYEMITTIEEENSLKSDHEIRVEQDRINLEIMKTGEADELDLEEASKQTAIEFEDSCLEELKSFESTHLDKVNHEVKDIKSINRALERSLILVVKQKVGAAEEWVFPHTPWQPGETLRQTCERLVQETCGSDLKVKFLGNAPCGFYKYKYPKTVRKEGFIGAKVFFYKCQVRNKDGSVIPGTNIVDHQWLTQDELDTRLKQSYAKSISKFLVSDR